MRCTLTLDTRGNTPRPEGDINPIFNGWVPKESDCLVLQINVARDETGITLLVEPVQKLHNAAPIIFYLTVIYLHGPYLEVSAIVSLVSSVIVKPSNETLALGPFKNKCSSATNDNRQIKLLACRDFGKAIRRLLVQYENEVRAFDAVSCVEG